MPGLGVSEGRQK